MKANEQNSSNYLFSLSPHFYTRSYTWIFNSIPRHGPFLFVFSFVRVTSLFRYTATFIVTNLETIGLEMSIEWTLRAQIMPCFNAIRIAPQFEEYYEPKIKSYRIIIRRTIISARERVQLISSYYVTQSAKANPSSTHYLVTILFYKNLWLLFIQNY